MSKYKNPRNSNSALLSRNFSDMNPVGPQWVQVSAEFPPKIIRLGSIYTQNTPYFHYTQEYNSPKILLARALRALARPAYSQGPFGPLLDRLTRAFGARARGIRSTKYASWQYTKIAYFRHKTLQLTSIPTGFEYSPP